MLSQNSQLISQSLSGAAADAEQLSPEEEALLLYAEEHGVEEEGAAADSEEDEPDDDGAADAPGHIDQGTFDAAVAALYSGGSLLSVQQGMEMLAQLTEETQAAAVLQGTGQLVSALKREVGVKRRQAHGKLPACVWCINNRCCCSTSKSIQWTLCLESGCVGHEDH